MFQKLTDLLREVFWLKKRPKRRTTGSTQKSRTKKPLKSRPKAKAIKKPALKPSRPSKPSKPPIAPSAGRPAKVPRRPPVDPSLVAVGEITQYFDRIKVCVVKINQGTILIGDRLTIAAAPKGARRGSAPFVQKVWSMQIDRGDVKIAKKGQLIGLKVDKPVSVGDIVYK